MNKSHNTDFSLLIKPVSYRCNLNCRYCFYLEKEQFFGSAATISQHVLEQLVSDFMSTSQANYAFAWQGGEPTLAGLDFYREAVRLMQKYGASGKNVSNGFQTNGSLLDDEWAEFFAQYRFLLGVSVDGPAQIHDTNRVNRSGSGTHAAVIRGIEALRRHQVEFNVLTLVNSTNVEEPLSVYRYLRDDLHVNFHQYIECVEFDQKGKLQPFAITAEKWGEFLCTIFDEWYQFDTRRVSVRLFDSILHRIVTGQPNTCAMSKECGQYLVVEHDGGVYPCDFFVRPELKLGIVGKQPLLSMLNSPKAREFAKRKSKVPAMCRNCRFYRFCAGDCPKNRFENHSLLCAGWKIFYEHALDRLLELAEGIKNSR